MKKCTKCLVEKGLEFFHKNSKSIDGHTCQCKECRNTLYYKPRPLEETVFIEDKIRICSKCKISKPFSEYTKNKSRKGGIESKCKTCIKSYKDNNKEKIKTYNNKYNNSEKGLNQKEESYDRNRDNIIKSSRERYKRIAKTEEFKKYNSERSKKRELEDNIYKLKKRVSCLIRGSFKRRELVKDNKSEDILGCTMDFFIEHIESQFLPWMSWENYGNVCEVLEYDCSWDLDHIIPVSLAQTEEDILSLNYWSNFQPLCSKINRHDKKNNF